MDTFNRVLIFWISTPTRPSMNIPTGCHWSITLRYLFFSSRSIHFFLKIKFLPEMIPAPYFAIGESFYRIDRGQKCERWISPFGENIRHGSDETQHDFLRILRRRNAGRLFWNVRNPPPSPPPTRKIFIDFSLQIYNIGVTLLASNLIIQFVLV